MTLLQRIVLIIFLLFTVSGVAAQHTIIDTDDIYGSDPLLYNGRFYTFFPPLNTGGTQFFSDAGFVTGSVTLRGVTYTDLLLNYDIYNQQLILKYTTRAGAASLIIISDAWLENFNFNGINFEAIPNHDTLKTIYQVLGTGLNRICYYWKKDLDLDSFLGARNHVFSPARKEMKMYTGNKIMEYRNNKSFYSLFGPGKSIAVKEYLRSNNLNVKKANDQAMIKLISYCNTLYTK